MRRDSIIKKETFIDNSGGMFVRTETRSSNTVTIEWVILNEKETPLKYFEDFNNLEKDYKELVKEES